MLSRRQLLGAVPTAALAGPAHAWEDPIARAYRQAIVVDTLSFDRAGFDPSALLAAGMTALVVDLFRFPRNLETAQAELQAWSSEFARPGSRFLPIRQATDFRRAKEAGRLGVVLASQSSDILGLPNFSGSNANLETLARLREQGLQVLQLTYTDANGLGSGYAEPRDAGLTRLGVVVVAEMNRLGMLIDISHCGDATSLHAIGLSKKPVAVTHSGCRALYDHPRNKPDEVLRRLADRGGYFGVYNSTLWMTDQSMGSVEDVVRHINHAIKVAGVDAVGFGSDQIAMGDPRPQAEKAANMLQFTRSTKGWPDGGPTRGYISASELDHPDRCDVLAHALARSGHKAAAIEKVIGGNFVRAFGAACG